MKKSILTSVIAFLVFTTCLGQSPASTETNSDARGPETAYSNSCSAFYPFTTGTTFQVANYDKDGKEVSVTDFKILSNRLEGGNEIASMESSFITDKSNIVMETTYDLVCSGDNVSMDFKSMMNPTMNEQFEKYDVDISGMDIVLPNNLFEGQQLPDAKMLIKVDMGAVKMAMGVEMKDRKVEGMETITTPAGTFECYIISYEVKTRMGLNKTNNAKQWIARGVGMVKQEDYNKKGKVTSSSILTAFNQ